LKTEDGNAGCSEEGEGRGKRAVVAGPNSAEEEDCPTEEEENGAEDEEDEEEGV
jgi:hypothetical protein